MGLAVGAAVAALVFMSPHQGTEKLTLEAAIRIALENSHAVSRARAEMYQSREQVNLSYAAMRPQVIGSATYTRFDQATTAEFPAMDPDGNPIRQKIVIQPEDSRTAQIAVSQQVDIVGRLRQGVRGAKAYEAASRLGLSAEEAEVVLRVKLAFFDVLRAQSGLEIAEEAVKNAEERQRVAEAHLEAGIASKIDVLRAKTQVAENRQRLISARNAVDLAKAAFNAALSRDVNIPFELQPSYTLPVCTRSIEELTARALKERAEIQQLEWIVRARQEILGAEELGSMPSLSLSLVGDYNFRTTVFNPRRERYTGVAVLSLPIFDGNVTRARVGQARAEEQKARTTLEEAKLGISLQVKQALLSLKDAEERLLTAEAALAEAEETLRLAQLRYKNELAIQLEVSDAELAFTQAKLNVSNARYDYLQAFSRLQRAVGSEEI